MGNAVYLNKKKKKMEGTGAKWTNGTKRGDCTNVNSERTANWSYIKGQGRERVERGWGKNQ